MNKAHIVLMAGGTGGHIFPALAVAKKFINEGYTVSWLGTENSMEARLIPKESIPIDYIPIQNVRGKGLLRWAFLPWRLLIAMVIARRFLKKRSAALVIGMGGFVSGPGALAARTLNIPLLIHEQNALAGMTNRYLAGIAQSVLTGFPNAFPASIKAEYVGNPVRGEFISLHQGPIKPAHQPLRVLVVGGSQGARIFNEIIPKTLAHLPKDSIELWQQTGEKLYDAALEHFKSANVTAKITPFITDMAAAYQWADLIICRAGALTVSELAAAKKPAILIPLPSAVDDHQRLNAEFLSQHNAGILILQKNCSSEKLLELLQNFIAAPMQLKAMAAKAGALAQLSATDKIFTHSLSLINPKKIG
jgi:UDP-N-acetylglucosamine--N-acetylmuramyl-(pentapeptide) pyrophosphoryl-undecaprenol N-acetylglucosamine transferase